MKRKNMKKETSEAILNKSTTVFQDRYTQEKNILEKSRASEVK
jgi:hypothetical protein